MNNTNLNERSIKSQSDCFCVLYVDTYVDKMFLYIYERALLLSTNLLYLLLVQQNFVFNFMKVTISNEYSLLRL